MKNKWFVLLAALMLILGTTACGGGDETPTEAPTEAPTEEPTQASGGDTVAIEIVNNTGGDIWYVYISPSTESTWGNDLLGANIIPNGESFTLDMPANTYDMRAEDSDHNEIETLWQVEVNGDYTWTVVGPATGGTTGEGDLSLEIVNNSGQDIWFAYVSPSSSSEWGSDQLGANIIPNGESFTITGIAPGTYDLKAEDSSHNVIATEMGVDIQEDMTWTISGGEGGDTGGEGDLSLEIVNNSGVDVWFVYVSPSSSADWGDDRLGADVLNDGESFTITGLAADTYDLKAEDSSHNPLFVEMGVEIMQDMTWTLNPAAGSEGGQWAIDAVASSEFSNPRWAAIQATGAPDTTECGDMTTAWASATTSDGEWLELTYATPVIPTQINIYETYNPGYIIRVEVISTVSEYHVVWEGRPRVVQQCPYVFSVPVSGIDFPVAGIRITVDQENLGSWNEIDAVELVGQPE